MASSRIADYVNQRRSEGYTTEEIRTVMHKAGYTTEEINSALGKSSGSGLTALIVLLVILLAGYGIFVMLNQEPALIIDDIPPEPVYDIANILTFSAAKCQNERIDHTCLAIAKSDSSLCENNMRAADVSECYLDYIFTHLTGSRTGADVALCNKLPESPLKGVCIAVSSGDGLGDISGCRRFGDEDSSLYCEAFVSADAGKCAGISDLDLKKSCADSVTLFRAVQSEEVSICDEIQETEVKLQCQARLTGDVNVCNSIVDLYCEEEAKLRAAEITGDPYICEQVKEDMTGDDNLQEKCYMYAAIKSRNPANCEGLDYPYDLACKGVLTSTGAHCGNIPETNFGTFDDMKDSCFVSVAQSSKDFGLCEYVKNPVTKVSCEELRQHLNIGG